MDIKILRERQVAFRFPRNTIRTKKNVQFTIRDRTKSKQNSLPSMQMLSTYVIFYLGKSLYGGTHWVHNFARGNNILKAPLWMCHIRGCILRREEMNCCNSRLYLHLFAPRSLTKTPVKTFILAKENSFKSIRLFFFKTLKETSFSFFLVRNRRLFLTGF